MSDKVLLGEIQDAIKQALGGRSVAGMHAGLDAVQRILDSKDDEIRVGDVAAAAWALDMRFDMRLRPAREPEGGGV